MTIRIHTQIHWKGNFLPQQFHHHFFKKNSGLTTSRVWALFLEKVGGFNMPQKQGAPNYDLHEVSKDPSVVLALYFTCVRELAQAPRETKNRQKTRGAFGNFCGFQWSLGISKISIGMLIGSIYLGITRMAKWKHKSSQSSCHADAARHVNLHSLRGCVRHRKKNIRCRPTADCRGM